MSDLFKATRIADCDSNEGWESCYNLIIAEAADQGSFSFYSMKRATAHALYYYLNIRKFAGANNPLDTATSCRIGVYSKL